MTLRRSKIIKQSVWIVILLLFILSMASATFALKNATSIISRIGLVSGVKGRIYYYPPRLNNGSGVYHRVAIERLPRQSAPGRFVEIGWVRQSGSSQYQTLIAYGVTGSSQFRNIFLSINQTPNYHDFEIIRKAQGNPRHEFYVDGVLNYVVPRHDQPQPCLPGDAYCWLGSNFALGDYAGAGGEVLLDVEDMFGILTTGNGVGTIIDGLQWRGNQNGVVAWYNWSGTQLYVQDWPYYNFIFPGIPTLVIDCGTGTPAGAPSIIIYC